MILLIKPFLSLDIPKLSKFEFSIAGIKIDWVTIVPEKLTPFISIVFYALEGALEEGLAS